MCSGEEKMAFENTSHNQARSVAGLTRWQYLNSWENPRDAFLDIAGGRQAA
jgi:hypothetical protein